MPITYDKVDTKYHTNEEYHRDKYCECSFHNVLLFLISAAIQQKGYKFVFFLQKKTQITLFIASVPNRAENRKAGTINSGLLYFMKCMD